MKQFFLASLAALALLSSCSEISTDPAPVRNVRTASTVTVNFARVTSALAPAQDTILVNPKLDIFTISSNLNPDGTQTYGGTGNLKLVASITDFSAPAPVTLSNLPIVVQDGVPSLGVRFVFSSSNRPGRRTVTAPFAQRLTANLLINGVSRVQFIHTGRTAVASSGSFVTTSDTNISGYVF